MAGWVAAGLLFLLLGVLAGFAFWAPGVVDRFEKVVTHSAENTLVYDKNGAVLAVIQGVEDRHTVPLNQISPFLQKAVVAIEDRRFFSHKGMDPIRLVGAAWENIRPGGTRQGASTITQQLIKLTLLSPKPTLSRKIKEVMMAMALERAYDKQKILELYLNQVYFAHGVYGVDKASRTYFHKLPAQLTLNEAAFLAALIKKPEGYLQPAKVDHTTPPPRLVLPPGAAVLTRQKEVLKSLRELGWASNEDLNQAWKEPLVLFKPDTRVRAASYFVDEVMKDLRGLLQVNRVAGRGYRVYTTLDPAMQQSAEDRVTSLNDKKFVNQGALIALEPYTGFVRALVGGVNYEESEFNRATQARRQPGSAIKPVLYAAALEEGYSPNSVFLDEPAPYEWKRPDGEFELYEPHNYDDHYGVMKEDPEAIYPLHKEMILAKALEVSSNVIAVKLLERLGMNRFVRFADRLGISINPKNGLCNALGCSEATPMELTAAYASFANGGLRVEPVTITKVTNTEGEVLYEYFPPPPVQAFSPWVAYQMNSMLQGVIARGTGMAARLNRPAGGKTGTNDGPRDTWFIGFTPDLVAGVWIGNDDNSIMPREAGGMTTARLWQEFMTRSTPAEKTYFPTPDEPFETVRVCNQSGELAGDWCPSTAVRPFRQGETPPEVCHLHQGPPVTRTVCLESGELATPYCPVGLRVTRRFYANHPPEKFCSIHGGSWQPTLTPPEERVDSPSLNSHPPQPGGTGGWPEPPTPVLPKPAARPFSVAPGNPAAVPPPERKAVQPPKTPAAAPPAAPSVYFQPSRPEEPGPGQPKAVPPKAAPLDDSPPALPERMPPEPAPPPPV
ncbi:MAG: PBP1A family penicillin-binding protein, partial [Deltaproteobacteria bacterium]|nr:PBP1A family penicillin-binding protein [Deltaproteobacteria bacterium]